MSRTSRRRTAAPTPAAPPRRITSDHFGWKLLGLFLLIGFGAFFVANHPMSDTRHVVLIVSGFCLLVFLGLHYRDGVPLLLVGIEYAAIITLVVTLLGGLAPATPAVPPATAQAPHGEHEQAGRTDAGFDLSKLDDSLLATCHKIPACDTVAGWTHHNRAALDARKPARRAKR
jgi:hypothetical protein